MPSKSHAAGFLAAVLLSVGQPLARADLLLGDDFTVTGTPNSEDANYNVAGRQTGSLAPVSWSEQGQGWQIQAGNGGANEILLARFAANDGSVPSPAAYLNFDFAPRLNLDNSVVEIRFDGRTIDNQGDNSNWFSLNLSNSMPGQGFVNTGTFGVLFRLSGSIQVFDGGDNLTPVEPAFTSALGTYASFMVRLSDTAGTGSAFNGAGARAEIFANSNLVGTYVIDNNALTGAYIGVGSYNGLHTIDNLTITAVPEAGAAGLVLLGAVVLLNARRRPPGHSADKE
ncbi:MAG: hypothetical protein U1F77_05175 [Kiritimatiellia bacterium]